MTAKLIVFPGKCRIPSTAIFPGKCRIPSAAIEDEIERLIAVLDERQAACEGLEPEPDFEDGGDTENEAWPDWRPSKDVLLRPRGKSGSGS